MEQVTILAQLTPTMKVQLLDAKTIRLDLNRLHIDLYNDELHQFTEMVRNSAEALLEIDDDYSGPLATLGKKGLIEKKKSGFIAIHFEGISFSFCSHGFKDLLELTFEADRNFEAYQEALRRDIPIDEDIHTLLKDIEERKE